MADCQSNVKTQSNKILEVEGFKSIAKYRRVNIPSTLKRGWNSCGKSCDIK